MRQQWAKMITLLTAILVIVLSVIFSLQQNTPPSISNPANKTENSFAPARALSQSDTEKTTQIATGRRVFETQGCMRCHSIAGKGNPRNPLDEVGKHLTAKAIRQWILAADELKAQLSTPTFLAKQAYRKLPEEDMDALVIYLQSLSPVTHK